jgi:hypothetical protein
MTFTMSMKGSQKFADLGLFPIDPSELTLLKTQARNDAVNFYLRLFFDGTFKTVILVDSVDNLRTIWTSVINAVGAITPELELALVSRVYEAFAMKKDDRVEPALTALKTLVMHHFPEFRAMATAPHRNTVGVIFEFDERRFRDWAYCYFSLDEIEDLSKHSIH